MAFNLVLDPANCANIGQPELARGEHISHVLEHAQLSSEVGAIGPRGKSIEGASGTLHATTQKLVWLEDGATNIDAKRSCSMPLAAMADVAMCTPPPRAVLRVVCVA